MKRDILKELEHLALTARLKRISDNMLYSAKDLYKTLDLDIDPNWHLIFMMFKKKDILTMTEIAEAFQISQTAVIKIIKKMKSKNYLINSKDPLDNRKQILQLSKKAKRELPMLEKVWEAGEKTIKDILHDNKEIFEQLNMIEEAINKASYKERTIKHLKND